MSDRRAVVVIEGGEVVETKVRNTLAEARAYADGYMDALEAEFEEDGYKVFVLPDDREKMFEDDDISERTFNEAVQIADEELRLAAD